jgi:hypothetical protein
MVNFTKLIVQSSLMQNDKLTIAEEVIISRIYLVRGKQVMFSHDLAELYQVQTKVLNQQVKRNLGKFPDRYMFQLTREDADHVRSQYVTFNNWKIKYLPYAFTEHGILMLASVLNSEKANRINFLIIDTFIKLRDLISLRTDVLTQLEQVQNRLSTHDNRIMAIFKYLKELDKLRQAEKLQKERTRIGFKQQ